MPTYRTDGAWGSGKGANLTPAEIDGNFYDHEQRIAAVEANPAEPVEIASVSATGTQMTIHMDDGTTRGPITLPTAVIRYRGDWTAGTAYLELDLVHVADDGLYLVLEDHTAAATFDPVADDGAGNLLYKWLLPVTADALTDAPADGTIYGRQDGAWVEAGGGGGGTSREVLSLTSGTWTLEAADADRQLIKFGSSALTIEIPADLSVDPVWPVGTIIPGVSQGGGVVTISLLGAGEYLNGVESGSATVDVPAAGAASRWELVRADVDQWLLTGDVSVVS